MITCTFQILRDDASPALVAMGEAVKPSRLARRCGPALARVTRNYLRGLPGNKRGWPSTQFYRQASDFVTWYATEDAAVTVIGKVGMRQRYFGGHIPPVNAGALTIPISPLSYGKTAKDFPGLFRIKTPKGAYLVQYTEGPGQRLRGSVAQQRKWGARVLRGTLTFLFKLSGGVDQDPDPTVIPSEDVYVTVAHEQILESLPKQITTLSE